MGARTPTSPRATLTHPKQERVSIFCMYVSKQISRPGTRRAGYRFRVESCIGFSTRGGIASVIRASADHSAKHDTGGRTVKSKAVREQKLCGDKKETGQGDNLDSRVMRHGDSGCEYNKEGTHHDIPEKATRFRTPCGPSQCPFY